MGTQALLTFGTACEFEASNCIPVTWLALFDCEEFQVKRRVEGLAQKELLPPPKPNPRGLLGLVLKASSMLRRGVTQDNRDGAQQAPLQPPEEYDVAIYQTITPLALARVRSAISRLSNYEPVWTVLRPLEILSNELAYCDEGQAIELDLTQFWTSGEAFRQVVQQAPDRFQAFLHALSGDATQDLAALDALIGAHSLSSLASAVRQPAEDRAFLLIGTYWGDEGREEQYSLEYFSET